MRKLKVLMFLTIIMIILIKGCVYAETSITAKLSANKDSINKDEEVELSLGFYDFKDIGIGINAYTATLNFDKNLFELKKIEGLNGWNSPSYNKINALEGSTKLAATINNFTKTEGNILKITLKSKQTITSSTEISIKGIEVATKENENTKKIKVGDVSIKQSIKNENSEQEKGNENSKDGVIKNDQSGILTKVAQLPKAGITSSIFTVLIVIAFSIICYLKVKEYKDIK